MFSGDASSPVITADGDVIDAPAGGGLRFVRMRPCDLFLIDVQDSQTMFLGQDATPDDETAETLAAQPVAWTAWRADGTVLACFGFSEAFPGRHGTAWALIGNGIGRDHLALTRFVRKVVAGCTLDRLDVLARCEDVEPLMLNGKAWPEGGALLRLALIEPTPQVRWCLMLGFEPAHLLRKFGGAGETYMMFERIRGRG